MWFLVRLRVDAAGVQLAYPATAPCPRFVYPPLPARRLVALAI